MSERTLRDDTTIIHKVAEDLRMAKSGEANERGLMTLALLRDKIGVDELLGTLDSPDGLTREEASIARNLLDPVVAQFTAPATSDAA